MLSAMQCWNVTYGLSKPALPGFQPMRSKAKTNRTLYALWAIQLQVIARNSDWFITLFAPVVIGRSNYFFDSHLKKVMDF